MPDSQQPLLISAPPPSRAQTQAALIVASLLLALSLPFGRVHLGQLNAFLPIVATVMFLTDSITAMLLFGQFSVLRSRALLVLANGYLFTALIVVFYALTFPGAFTPTGLLGAGLQSAGWLFMIWHIGLPTTVVAYTLLNKASPEVQMVRMSAPIAILASFAVVILILIVCGLTWFIISYDELLPVLVLNLIDVSGLRSVTLTALALSLAAIVLLWVWKKSILDLWLLVVSLAWLLDPVFMFLTESRYSVAWYANRILGISSASFVLFVLLAESMALYARLAHFVLAQSREREGRRISMDAISAAIAHEIKQPLGAIAANANAGLRWLTKTPPGFDEARETFKDIVASSHRASEVIQSTRAMFKQKEHGGALLDTNEVIGETIAIARAELEAAQIDIQLELDPQLPFISAHRGQVQPCPTILNARCRNDRTAKIDRVYYHEKTIDEVAGIIGAPRNTVKTRMFYARKQLAALLGAQGMLAA